MSERSERIIVTVPKAHGCTISSVKVGADHEAISSVKVGADHEAMVHQ